MKYRINRYLLIIIIFFAISYGCSSSVDPTGISGVSISGYTVGISAIFSGFSVPADGSEPAIIRVEVWNTAGQFVDNVPVTLVASLGTLGSSSLTTENGVAITTFTGSTPGNATITALVENVGASATLRVR